MAETRVQLRGVLAAAITLLAGTLVAVSTFAVGQVAASRVRDEIGRSLALLADQMQDKLDRALYERFREVSNLASLLSQQSQSQSDPARQTAWLAAIQSAYPEYSWLGIAGADGHVLISTGGVSVGTNISDRTWFKAGLTRPVVSESPLVSSSIPGTSSITDARGTGQSHKEATAPASSSAMPSEPLSHIVAIAAPIVSPDGKTVAVLAAQLGWTWAQEVRDSLFGATAAYRSAEALVLNSDGAVILGPPELYGRALSVGSVESAKSGANRFAVEDWPDGRSYVTGYAKSDGHRSFQGLGEIVLVRADADVALAPVSKLTREIAFLELVSVCLAAVAAWILAGRMAAPLLTLATAAAKIRRGEATDIPEVGTYAEAETLAQSLRILVSELQRRQKALVDLNASLENQVSERTRRLAEQNVAFEAAKVEAEQATAAKSLFLATASHDLRQPLHAMSLFSRALSRRVSGAEARRLLTQLEECLSSLREMFDALLNVSRLDAGLIRAEISPVPVKQLIERISGGLKADAEHSGLRFKSRSVDVIINSDPVILETILRNLVANAFKFTATGGVLLAARRRGAGISIEIYDTGSGIPADQHDRIFCEFERSKVQAGGTNEGLGLGLSIVRRYAQLLGLKVTLTSRVGRGSRFAIMIPEALTASSAEAAQTDGARFVVGDLNGRRILVLDDDAAIVAALQQEFCDRGADVRGFVSAPEAEAAIATGFAPDAAIVDFDLRSSERGPVAIRKLATLLGRPIPALVLSGATDRETLTQLATSGLPWLTKPANPDVIVAAVLRLCNEGIAHRARPQPAEFLRTQRA